MTPRAAARSLLPVVVAAAAAAPGGAQEPDLWTVEGELGASLFFGNTEQATLTSRLGAAMADSTRELDAAAAFTYGEASDADGDDFVIKRSWEVGLTYDHHPFETVSPFVMGKLESSFEKRIEQRYNVGAGAKYTFDRRPQQRVDVSLALLAERTNPADQAPAAETELLARWSTRLRGRRTLADERVTVTHETFYRPEFAEVSDFTLATTTSLSFQLNEVVALKLTFVDSYDSEAEARGARTNNDGQLFFSVLSSFE